MKNKTKERKKASPIKYNLTLLISLKYFKSYLSFVYIIHNSNKTRAKINLFMNYSSKRYAVTIRIKYENTFHCLGDHLLMRGLNNLPLPSAIRRITMWSVHYMSHTLHVFHPVITTGIDEERRSHVSLWPLHQNSSINTTTGMLSEPPLSRECSRYLNRLVSPS